ncbi:MAG: hypothetical protein ABIQ66_01565 [Novosphingobium sp.]
MRISVRVALSLALAVPLLTGCKSLFSARGSSHVEVKLQDDQQLAQYAPMQMEIGRQALANGEYGLALIAFRNAQHDPVWTAAAHNGMAVAFDEIGRPDLAEGFFQQAIADNPEDPRYQANLQHFYASSAAIPIKTERPEQLASAMTVQLPEPDGAKADGSRPDIVYVGSANRSRTAMNDQPMVLKRVSAQEVQISRPQVAVATRNQRPGSRPRAAVATSTGRAVPAYPVRITFSPNY